MLMVGKNRLDIEIVNQRWNQLIGDEQPGAVRMSKVLAQLFREANDMLVPAGLLEPVVLENIQ